MAYGVYRLIEWPGFRLRHTVVQGAQATSRADVIARASFGAHPNMWLVDLGAAQTRIEALPYVRSATLIRIPPATISTTVACGGDPGLQPFPYGSVLTILQPECIIAGE